jgi:HAD superfamily hydrolase (TIGR01509 family)
MPELPGTGALRAVVFDVDGVLVASPHEKAWRDALAGFADPARLTTEVYQSQVAGKPRDSGALAALEALGVPDAARVAPIYAERKQKMIEDLIAARDFTAFPDAVRFLLAVRAAGFRVAVASSSRNANQMMQMIPTETGGTLLDLFDANLCGRDLRQGKPHPEIFLLAAAALGVPPSACVVVEDAPSGIEAARAGGMRALGIARLDDAALLHAAGADLVVTSLDEVAVDGLAGGHLTRQDRNGKSLQ